MLVHHDCILCNLKQVYKIIKICNLNERLARKLIEKVMNYLAAMDYSKTNSEIMGETWQLILDEINDGNPYSEIKRKYNQILLDIEEEVLEYINSFDDKLGMALKLSIIGNQIDFASGREVDFTSEKLYLQSCQELAANDSNKLFAELSYAKKLLYIGDNCGEIVLDKILIKMIKSFYPRLIVYYGVRGTNIINDVTISDFNMVGLDVFATAVDNGSKDLGTVLPNTSKEFRTVFEAADVIISKGQGNFESLYNNSNKQIYYLLKVKCERISNLFNLPVDSLVCSKL